MIDWSSETWGQVGSNVHYASNGSWIGTEGAEEQ